MIDICIQVSYREENENCSLQVLYISLYRTVETYDLFEKWMLYILRR